MEELLQEMREALNREGRFRWMDTQEEVCALNELVEKAYDELKDINSIKAGAVNDAIRQLISRCEKITDPEHRFGAGVCISLLTNYANKLEEGE